VLECLRERFSVRDTFLDIAPKAEKMFAIPKDIHGKAVRFAARRPGFGPASGQLARSRSSENV